METKLRPITHIITSGSGPSKLYSRYKIVMEGTIRETGDPARYCQWCKVGLGWNGNNPVYGSSYYTVESYELINGSYWDTYSEANYPPSNLFIDNLHKKIDWQYNTGHKDDCYLEVIFNTNNAIVPTSLGLISADNANGYTQRPEYFKLYGWDNGWDLITIVNGEDTLSGDNVESIFNISSSSSTIIRPVTIFEHIPDPPQPSVEYDYVIKLWTDTSYFYLTALCLDRNQEGVGNYYSDAECTNEFTELGNWSAFNSPTLIFTEEDQDNPGYRVATIYAKNLNISNDGYGTIINAYISNWNWGYVYDNYGNIISSQIPQSTEQYTNIYYN